MLLLAVIGTSLVQHTCLFVFNLSLISSCPEALDQREVQLEIQILKKYRHEHLITLFAVCSSTPPYYIITELMEKGNLQSFLRGQHLPPSASC